MSFYEKYILNLLEMGVMDVDINFISDNRDKFYTND